MAISVDGWSYLGVWRLLQLGRDTETTPTFIGCHSWTLLIIPSNHCKTMHILRNNIKVTMIFLNDYVKYCNLTFIQTRGHGMLREPFCSSFSLTLWNTHFRVSWRPLVKEHIPNIGLWWHNFQKKEASVFYADCFGPSPKHQLSVSWRSLVKELILIIGQW